MAAKKTEHKPRSIRFSPDPGTLAEIRFEAEGIYVFGLVINESATGFSAVLNTDKAILVGATCLCKVGNLEWTYAEVRWAKALEADIIQLGLEYQLKK